MLHEIHDVPALRAHLAAGRGLRGVAIQGLDLRQETVLLCAQPAEGLILLGCTLTPQAHDHILATGGLVFPQVQGLPYHPFRPRLYTVAELMAGYRRGHPESFQQDTYDSAVYRHYQHYQSQPGPSSVLETLTQRLHDHAIDDALNDLLHDGDRQVVGVMGGHALSRAEPIYRAVAQVGQHLARAGLFVATGGGPGAMEAANLGAYMAPYSDDALGEAITLLQQAPNYSDPLWLETAYTVRDRWPSAAESLSIPTWFYGHEPSNLFASHIAKYFANSIREDGLLAIATRGVIYTPGSAGTIQEIFMDAAQNHYGTFKVVSPMLFLGRDYWTREKPVYPLLQALAAGRTYAQLLAISDDVDDIVSFILDNPPIPFPGT